MARFITKNITNTLEMQPIVFFGTGDVSLRSLKSLSNSFSIEAVITKPDTKSHGRTSAPAVKQWAEMNNVSVFQPKNKKELSLVFEKERFISKVGIVIDYGLIITEDVIDYFPFGIVNSHFSLLPQWRGADPITFAILSGQDTTGVSVMKIKPTLDTGDLLDQQELKIKQNETSETLTTKLIELSNDMLERIIPLYLSDQITLTPQGDRTVSYSRKLTKNDGLLDWKKPAKQLEREVRAYQPWPTSFTDIEGEKITVLEAKVIKAKSTKQKPGSPVLVGKNQLAIVAGDGLLELIHIKPAGKSEMSAAAFLAGRPTFKKSLKQITV